jgi:Domain of unknown function (DUF5655)/Domain of unknown function (DUF4287)
MPRIAQPSALYDVHPGVAMVQNAMAKLKEKSGRDLDEWIAFIKKAGPATEVERRDWLKKEHGFGTNYSWWLAERAEGKGTEDGDPEEYLRAAVVHVEEMYAGAKAGLRPIHDELLKLGRKLGKDVKVCPCKTIVPLYRNHVFAQIKPATRTRIDLGFAFGNMKASGRLIDTGGFAKKDRITHRIPLTSVKEIDDEVKLWLKKAYEMDG